MTEHFDPTAPQPYGGFTAPPVDPATGAQPDPAPASLATPATSAKLTGQEVANSLTGFDEIAIKQAFGNSLDQLDPITVARACGFVLMRRSGQGDRDAYHSVMSMTQGSLQDLFAVEDDVDDRDPFAESSALGKEPQPSATPMTSSPPSAS
ncbi:hypothetical protein [Nocardioides marmoraquaticus]